MDQERWRRAAWLRAKVRWDRLSRTRGWPPGMDGSGTMEALASRQLAPWIPPRAPGVDLVLVRGVVPPGPRVAVVGARATDPYGRSCAARVARDAVDLGCVVVSGGAEGCDAAAHEAALEAGGHTLVVFAGGHDHPFPAAHRALFERVVDSGGALLSPCWPTVRPVRWRFLARNKVIAALSDITVVARARTRSGSLATARAARALRRPVLAIPGDVGQGLSQGCHDLLVAGAGLALGPGSLASALNLERRERGGGARWPLVHGGCGDPWSGTHGSNRPEVRAPHLEAVSSALARSSVLDPQGLVGQTDLTVGTVMSSLLELQLLGLVEPLAGDRFRWVGAPTGEKSST